MQRCHSALLLLLWVLEWEQPAVLYEHQGGRDEESEVKMSSVRITWAISTNLSQKSVRGGGVQRKRWAVNSWRPKELKRVVRRRANVDRKSHCWKRGVQPLYNHAALLCAVMSFRQLDPPDFTNSLFAMVRWKVWEPDQSRNCIGFQNPTTFPTTFRVGK